MYFLTNVGQFDVLLICVILGLITYRLPQFSHLTSSLPLAEDSKA
jgi:hypothetical protein